MSTSGLIFKRMERAKYPSRVAKYGIRSATNKIHCCRSKVQTWHRHILVHLKNYLLDMCKTAFGDKPKSPNVLESSERRCFGNPKYN